jgi:predicted amidophosphoribosyltransferase
MITCRAENHRVQSLTKIFSLCPSCERNLLPSPHLCPICYDFHPSPPDQCPNSFLRISGVQGEESFESLHSFFFLTDQSKSFFRTWKKEPHLFGIRPLIPREPGSRVESVWTRLTQISAHAIYPVPQRAERILTLRRSTSLEVAHEIGYQLGIPIRADRFLAEASHLNVQQGKKKGGTRYASNSPFKPAPNHFGERIEQEVIIVDDLMTSGQTLRNFARLLRSRGAERIHVAVLAIRPRSRGTLDLSPR